MFACMCLFVIVMWYFRSVPGFSCFLDENGEVVDFLRLAHLLTHRNSRNDHDRLKKVTNMSACTILCQSK